MIINRSHVEEAAVLLGFKVDELPANSEQVNAAYRNRALQTHPDKEGGSIEAFAAVDRAKHVLLKWLERSSEAVPGALGAKCAKCHGDGFLRIQRGFRSMRMQCPKCHGTGDGDYERDRTGTDGF